MTAVVGVAASLADIDFAAAAAAAAGGVADVALAGPVPADPPRASVSAFLPSRLKTPPLNQNRPPLMPPPPLNGKRLP